MAPRRLGGRVLGSDGPPEVIDSTTPDRPRLPGASYDENVVPEYGESPSLETAEPLLCPICSDQMLNQHLDDVHANPEESRQKNEAQDWLRIQMVKAQHRFKPLALLNQRIKGLDVFESNAVRSQTPSPRAMPEPAPDDVVQRTHWQTRSVTDYCADPACDKRLGGSIGVVNCRHCGLLFCNEHTLYEMKLSRSAQHEPVRGFWCRVCRICYESRPGYNEKRGPERDRTAEFLAARARMHDQTSLAVARLEKRLIKLVELLLDPPSMKVDDGEEGTVRRLWAITGAKVPRKQLEQSVVDWEDDLSVARCPFCAQEFSAYLFRRHHCRLCGRVVCGDPELDCSEDVALTVIARQQGPDILPGHRIAIGNGPDVVVDLRICRDCRRLVFRNTDFVEDKPPDVRAYENLLQFERGIELMLPRFHRLLNALQSSAPTPIQLADAARTRKRLIDAFGQYSAAARRLRDLPPKSETQRLLQNAVYQRSFNFLQTHMLPLQSLPKTLKHASSHLSPIQALQVRNGTSCDSSSLASSNSEVSAMEVEEKDLRETLVVLEEQLFMVQQQLTIANKNRRWDEATSLGSSVDDLQHEIGRLKAQLARLDFAAAYAPP